MPKRVVAPALVGRADELELLASTVAEPPAQPAPLDDRAAERHRVFRGLVEVLGSLGPAVVGLGDVHWVDEHSVEFLGYLLDDPPPELSLVLMFRSDEIHPEVRTLTSKLPEVLSRAQVVLASLGAQQTGALATSLLGHGDSDLQRAARTGRTDRCPR